MKNNQESFLGNQMCVCMSVCVVEKLREGRRWEGREYKGWLQSHIRA